MTKKQIARLHPLYRTWAMMRNRCYSPTAHNYYLYGGRGIYICDRWLNSFWDFVEDVGKRPYGHQLDRIDNDGIYEPSNIKWSTRSEQQRNTQRTRWVTAESGETQPMIYWCEIAAQYGVTEGAFRHRVRNGQTVEQAMSYPNKWRKAA